MANFIIPPEEFFASVGEPGGLYANSMDEWRERTKAREAGEAGEVVEAGEVMEADRKAVMKHFNTLVAQPHSIGITLPQSDDITLQKCSRCKCFHAGKCAESREDRRLEGDSL